MGVVSVEAIFFNCLLPPASLYVMGYNIISLNCYLFIIGGFVSRHNQQFSVRLSSEIFRTEKVADKSPKAGEHL